MPARILAATAVAVLVGAASAHASVAVSGVATASHPVSFYEDGGLGPAYVWTTEPHRFYACAVAEVATSRGPVGGLAKTGCGYTDNRYGDWPGTYGWPTWTWAVQPRNGYAVKVTVFPTSGSHRVIGGDGSGAAYRCYMVPGSC